MPLSTGSRIGIYEVTALLGEGGMGQVYRARDTRLDRDVAIKVLPDLFVADPERVARFEREAKTLASLNHPHIGAIYGLEDAGGVKALVLELVDGPTLADRIAQGPLSLDEALPIAKQIADALAAAHEQGIIHRDLKPANIKVRPDGTVKVLDFGLAKALDKGPRGDSIPLSPSLSPTVLSPAVTGVGVIMGTAAYMAPEQARGRSLDKRADIWAFGCVLYEMLTARRAFEDEDVSLTLSKVLQRDPDWSALSGETPWPVSLLLRRCLEKDPHRRVRDIGEAWSALEASLVEPVPSTALAGSDRTAHIGNKLRLSSWALAGMAAIVAAAVTGVVAWQLRSAAGPAVVKRFVMPLPDGDTFSSVNRRFLAVSPDASHIAYLSNRQLYVRAIDQLTADPVAGTTAASSPFFSHDGQWLGFWQDGQLKKVALTGGAPQVLCDTGNPYGVSWGQDGFVLFSQGRDGISRVPEGGGTPSLLISMDKAKGEVAYGPQLLPDGKTILFTLLSGGSRTQGTAAWDNAEVVVQDTESPKRQTVVQGGTAAQYLPTGHIVYVRGNTLLAVPFDTARRQLTGNPVSLVQSVGANSGVTGGINVANEGSATGAGQFSVSANGLLVYAEPAGSGNARTLVWVDRRGNESPVAGLLQERAFAYPRIAPDGTRVALDIRDQEEDIWVFDFEAKTLTRLTRSPVNDISPVWTPNSERIAFFRLGEGLLWQPANGTGSPEALTKTTTDLHAADVIAGKQLIFEEQTPTAAAHTIKSLNLDDRTTATVISDTQSNQNAAISPDGRLIAYQSGPVGGGAQGQEIYVRPFPDVDKDKWQISTGGGATRPVWSRNGRELFYLVQKEGGQGRSPSATIMAVAVETSPRFKRGNPTPLFSGPYYAGGLTGLTYDVDLSGQRFLMVKNAQASATRPQRLLVVENWFEELKARVPKSK